MNNSTRLVQLSIGLTILLALAALEDFLCLHDIFRDYVSPSALDYLGVTPSEPLPEWTSTSLEWTSLTVSYWLRVGIICLNIVVLMKLKSRPKPADGADPSG